MIKKIINIGNSQGITFSKNEMEQYGMVVGDTIDLRNSFLIDAVKIKRKKNENK